MTRAEMLALLAVVTLAALIALAPTLDAIATTTATLEGIN